MNQFENTGDVVHGALILAGFWIVMSVVMLIVLTTWQVLKMGKGIKLEPASREANRRQYEELAPFDEWAARNGFEFLSAYTMQAIAKSFLGVWRHRQDATYFVLTLAGSKKMPSFTSEFSVERSLDTVGAGLEMTLPSIPGSYKQSFAKASLDELYARHLEAMQYLTRVGQMRCEPSGYGIEEAVPREFRRQAAYIRALPAWPLRAIYWYHVARRRKLGKTIEQQHKAGLVLLPNDPGFRDFCYQS